MAEFVYGLVGDPIPKKGATPAGGWRPCVQAHRIQWFLGDGGPWKLDAGASKGREIVLIRQDHPAWKGPHGNITSIRFCIFPSQEDLYRNRRKLNYLPALIDPEVIRQIGTDAQFTRKQMKQQLSLCYLGFRVTALELPERQAVARALDVPGILGAAGIPAQWHPRGLLPPGATPPPVGKPASGAPSGQPGAGGGTPRKLLYNLCESVDRTIADQVEEQWRAGGPAPGVEAVGYRHYLDLIEAIGRGEGDAFLCHWHIKAGEAIRVLKPLFHSGSAGTNLTGYNGADKEIEAVEASPTAANIRACVNKILGDVAVIPLYHPRRTVAWRKVSGLVLTDPEGNPKDQLVTASIER
jgi:hypothetical protein